MHNLLGGIFVIALLIPVGLGLFANGVTADKVCGSSGGSHQSAFYTVNNPIVAFDNNYNTMGESNIHQPMNVTGSTIAPSWIGKELTKITIYTGKHGTLTGNIQAGVFDKTTGNLVANFGTMSANSLAELGNFFNSSDSNTLSPYTFTGDRVLQSNDIIGFSYTGGNFDNSTNNGYNVVGAFADFSAPVSNTQAWDNLFGDEGGNFNAIFYETVSGGGHNPHCVEALNVALLTPLIAVGGIIVLLIKRYNDN